MEILRDLAELYDYEFGNADGSLRAIAEAAVQATLDAVVSSVPHGRERVLVGRETLSYAASALESSGDNGDRYCARQIRDALSPQVVAPDGGEPRHVHNVLRYTDSVSLGREEFCGSCGSDAEQMNRELAIRGMTYWAIHAADPAVRADCAQARAALTAGSTPVDEAAIRAELTRHASDISRADYCVCGEKVKTNMVEHQAAALSEFMRAALHG